ncbi:MAG: hypothetical protein R2729_16685 [Bryobacteraceae bacterium]
MTEEDPVGLLNEARGSKDFIERALYDDAFGQWPLARRLTRRCRERIESAAAPPVEIEALLPEVVRERALLGLDPPSLAPPAQ